jgi:hypothetical protein
MFVFACPIIARSQCWLFALRANIRISVFAPNSTSGVCAFISYFNQINTFQIKPDSGTGGLIWVEG